MNWSNTFFLTLALLSCVFVMVRIERKWWFIGALFYVLPVLLLMALWAAVTASWPEVGLAAMLAAVLGGLWWLIWGRHVKPADSSGIQVWGQDARPKPKAALQAEIDQLKEEKAKLEEELRKLKGDRDAIS